jgi:hypothetical protein
VPDTDIATDQALPPEEQPRKVKFLQQPWVQDFLPLATSILFHAAIIVIGLATYQAVKTFTEVTKEQPLIPDAAIVDGDAGGIPHPGLGGDPTRDAAQDQFKDVPTQQDAWNTKPSESLAQTLAGAQGETTESMIGQGPNSAFGTATGAPNGSGAGDAAGGALAPYGLPGGGGGIGPKSPFMGVSGNARTVAYVCDGSGSMLGLQFDLLKQEITKAVDQLKPIQRYNVIFFQEGAAVSVAQTLLPAIPSNKVKTYDFLKKVSLGANSDPISGLQLAFRQKPQLIFLLTDGAFADNQAVIDEIAKLNADKSVHVNTIAFFSGSSSDSDRIACENVLRTIAADNGGKFTTVMVSDLK